MSYYILPNHNREIQINLFFSKEPQKPLISFSLMNHIKSTEKQINDVKVLQVEDHIRETKIENICSLLNPYEYVFSCVPESKYSVSKLKPDSNTFYLLMEIIYTFKILDSFSGENIKTLHIGDHDKTNSSIECLNTLRDDYLDDNQQIIIGEEKPKFHKNFFEEEMKQSSNFIFFESPIKNYENYGNVNKYVEGLLYICCVILNCQALGGTCIIKVNDLCHKPIIDILFILAGLYDKVYVIKPNVLNIFTSERFIVCKNFINIKENKKCMIFKEVFKNFEVDGEHLLSVLPYELPYYFLNKIEESNIIIGQQQLYIMDQMLSVIKNKNVDDKLETIKKINIQKSIQWCEKYKIPYNKFLDKINIFLPIDCDELVENSLLA